jgi:hypothetical protein
LWALSRITTWRWIEHDGAGTAHRHADANCIGLFNNR